MEVHHHSHSAAPDPSISPGHRGRHKWTHYFWEFFMLFLAVFCGFLAEYQLEHKIEKEKGKQYIRSFYKDLTTDTAVFSRLIISYETKIASMKTEAACFDSLDKDLRSENCFWNLIANSSFFDDFNYTDRTLQQLKNAGGLRLLNSADADSILLYDNKLKLCKLAEGTSMQESQAGIRNTIYSLINHKKFLGNNTVGFLYGNNKELLNKFFNQLAGYGAVSEVLLKDLKDVKETAVHLIAYFKTKYKLK